MCYENSSAEADGFDAPIQTAVVADPAGLAATHKPQRPQKKTQSP